MKKIFLFTLPLVIAAVLYSITQIAGLLTQPNDVAVAFGILTGCVLLALIYYYIKFFIQQFKTKAK